MEKQFEVRYGTPASYKSVEAKDREQAERMFDKACRFAKGHRLPWVVALWERGWLEKSVAFEGGTQA